MFRSSGPRARRPSTLQAPRDARVARRQSALLQSAQLIVAAVDPTNEPHDAWWRRTDRHRAAVIRYLQAQGGEVRSERGLATAHLRVALGAGPSLGRLLRAMEHDGEIVRDMRGRRTFAVRLTDVAPPAPIARDVDASAAPVDYATFARAMRRIIVTRLAATDPIHRERRALLERYVTQIDQGLVEYAAAVARSDRDGLAFFATKRDVIAKLIADYEARTGVRIDDALTDTEHEHVHGVLRTIPRR